VTELSDQDCIVFGIPNCDQIKKARRWLDEQGIAYRFHDYRRDGIDAALLAPWLKAFAWETLINRQGTTWRALPEDQRPTDTASAVALMIAKPAMIRRPALQVGEQRLLGFDAARWAQVMA